MNGPKVFYVFNRPRWEKQRLYERGRCPDDALYGMNTLRKRGFTVEFSDDGHDFSSWRSRLILPVGDVLSEKGRRVGFHLWQAMTLREKLKRADLIFATADSSALPLLRDKAKRRLSAPIVYATIGLAESFPDRRGWIYRYYKELAASADALIHYGEAEGRGLIERFGVPRERVHFVPFGVDTAFYDKAPSYDGPPIALGIDPRRDWPLLARALQGTGITMRVYTNPDLLRGINPPAEFERHAPVPSDVVADLLAEAAFVVLPVVENSYTGATITLLSAMAAGKAVIVSRTAAIKRRLRAGEWAKLRARSAGRRRGATQRNSLFKW
ncbi:MAG: glycosyltransferase [Deltaproteobacteria bacterium]|nr:glycosyltransferase [Deltaproteobacteria bacterium]